LVKTSRRMIQIKAVARQPPEESGCKLLNVERVKQ
jgi:hypothetical protein